MHTTLMQAQHQIRALYSLRNNELDALFSTLEAGAKPAGRLHGHLFAIRYIEALPRPISKLLYALLGTWVNPWRGKSFNYTREDARGSNIWLVLDQHRQQSRFRFGHYRIEEKPGPDGQPSLWLDYNLPENPGLLRAIRGEARALQPGLWLCRMLWADGTGHHHPVLWFTLHTPDAV